MKDLQSEQGGDLNQVHGEEGQGIIARKQGVAALEHLQHTELEAVLRFPKPGQEKDLVHDPVAKCLGLGCHDLRIALRNEIGISEGRREVPVALQRAHRTMDARIAFDGHQLSMGSVHQIQRKLPRKVHAFPQAFAQISDLFILLLELTVHEARGCRLKELKAGKMTLVVKSVAAVLRLLQDLLNDVGNFLGCIPGSEVLPLPLFVVNRQEENLCASFWVVDGRLNNELLATGLKCLEEP
mmetsp:Transcript_40054/g.55878  ORF Transcript_40054/g.55878 Transcript_40054/m.55878 type:complete len:240 (+) Transcript_40054:291-1010(+)